MNLTVKQSRRILFWWELPLAAVPCFALWATAVYFRSRLKSPATSFFDRKKGSTRPLLSPAKFRPDFVKTNGDLMQTWKTAVREFSRAADAFSDAIRIFPSAECDRLRVEVARARLASDNARLSLAMHRNKHGC